MVRVSKKQAEDAKSRGAKVTKKLQVREKPAPRPVEAKPVQPVKNQSIDDLAKLVEANAIENERRFTRQDVLIGKLAEAIQLIASDDDAKPVRLKIKRETSPQRLIEYIDLVPLKRVTH